MLMNWTTQLSWQRNWSKSGSTDDMQPGLKVRRVATGRRPGALQCAGSLPGLFVYSFTVSPVAVIEPDIYGLNNETTEWRSSRRPATAASAMLLSNTLLILFMRARGLWNCTQNTPKCIIFTWKKIKKKFMGRRNGASQETRLLS